MAIGALEFSANPWTCVDPCVYAFAIDPVAINQVPTHAIGNPGGQEQTLDGMVAFHIDIELHHLLQSIAA